jgi:hypothetical protein
MGDFGQQILTMNLTTLSTLATVNLVRKPDRVKAAKLKIARAKTHLKTIKRWIAEYAASRPYDLTKTKGKQSKRLRIFRAPSPNISILAGEMLYQMRSALDHLAFGLVERNAKGISLPPNWERRCEFPIFIDIPRVGNPPVPYTPPLPYAQFSKALPGISMAAFTFIESLQPYYRSQAINTTLLFLGNLSNIDKHRYLNIVGGRVREHHRIRFASGLSSSGNRALDHGAEVPPLTGWDISDKPVYVNRRFEAFVHFKERDALGGAVALQMEYLLEFMLEQIEIIIPALDRFINKP